MAMYVTLFVRKKKKNNNYKGKNVTLVTNSQYGKEE